MTNAELLLSQLSRDDIEWLLAEYEISSLTPLESVPPALFAAGLVDLTMINSGRNPVYGWQLSAPGENFAKWLRLTAMNEFLDKRKGR